MREEDIKQAFSRVKEDMYFLNSQIKELKKELQETKILLKTSENRDFIENKPQTDTSTDRQINSTDTSTDRQINSTHPVNSTDTSTVPMETGGLKSPNLSISIGNEGVSTDRQTDTSTDRQTQKDEKNTLESDIQEASTIFESLDKIKKDIRNKFKKLTPQEMAVFSSIYTLEDISPEKANYREIAFRLHLSESSIRDYVQRMMLKGIPIRKEKTNNKQIILSVSSELRKIVTLSTIIQLREL
jgi:hypothetical protein